MDIKLNAFKFKNDNNVISEFKFFFFFNSAKLFKT